MANKIKYLIVTLLNLCTLSLYGQVPDSTKYFENDYAIGQSPALNVIDGENSITNPAANRKLTLIMTNLITPEYSLQLPKTFSVEFSPSLLFNGQNLSIDEYRKHPLLYRLRISAAFKSPSEEIPNHDYALGIRLNIIDRSDLRMNDEYINESEKLAETINREIFEKRIIDSTGKLIGNDSTDSIAESVLSASERSLLDKWTGEFSEKWMNKTWNAEVFEMSAACQVSQGTSRIFFKRIVFGGSYGYPLGSVSQFLCGLRLGLSRTDSSEPIIKSIESSIRVKLGRNNFQVYLELFNRLSDKFRPESTLSTGLNMRFLNHSWVTIKGGITLVNGNFEIPKSDISFGIGLNELFKF